MKAHGWLFAAAGYNLALALFHLCFWRIFRWREELPRMHPTNRGVMQVLNIMLVCFFLLCAILQAMWPDEVATTPLGRALLVGLTGFWILRAALQPVFWPRLGIRSWGFCFLFLVGAGLHAAALWGG